MDADGVPEFDEIASHDALVDWSRAYAREARREWVLDVRLDLVEWEVSTRARRRAAAVKRPRLDDASVGDPYDWEDVEGSDGRPLPCTVSLTWDAFDEFSREEWQSTLRHELVHVEQYQRFGTTGHGKRFKRRAAEMETAVHCRTFAEPEWTFYCESCDEVTAHRYRECKLVREYDRYRSNCCEAPLRRTSPGD
ncbi:SprT-like family protein [Halomicrobium zhouii]|uniref:SprT-like family protein n=1 Tax=Halomicrobium zhouii TaxID=767519 RepID=A0A1I6KME4_9EURY|nr:SprT-like domain-containing protein [Halomicrobium zhouii]SFR92425.1 SprT-like family protein [Halomicrobium zhouii]